MNAEEVAKLEVLVDEYIDGANEHEDQPLTEIEIRRLRDFVLYAQMTKEE